MRGFSMSVQGSKYLENVIQKCDATMQKLAQLGMSPDNEKKFSRLFSVTETAEMVGRSRATLYQLGDELACPIKNLQTGRVKGYTLDQVNSIREYFKTLPWRKPDEKCVKLAIQSFKGGVSKSVTTVYLAQFLALKGYRILIVDCDPQASATSSFGFVPDQQFMQEHTIAAYLDGIHETLDYAIIKTYFPGISLVPSCLQLYEAEFGLFNAISHAKSVEEKVDYYYEFSNAIASVEDQFDIILLDSPPALGMISINILVAANALIVPTPPSLYDFSSTIQYFRMIKKVVEGITPDKKFEFIKVMAAKVEKGKAKQIDFLSIMRDQFGSSIFNAVFSLTSSIPNAASLYQTIYDTPMKDNKVSMMLNTIFKEMENEIRKCWPSHKRKLEEEGVI